MTAAQVYNVKFDTTDDGFESLSESEIKVLEDDIEGRIFEIDCDPNNKEKFEYLICEEITSETGWLVNHFNYQHIVIGDKENKTS